MAEGLTNALLELFDAKSVASNYCTLVQSNEVFYFLYCSLYSGAVELEGLYIRKDALKDLDLPGIEVKWGYIGNITLRIPSYRNYR